MVEQGEFLEIFIDTPIEVAEQRDPKGLYKKVRRGELKNFTGIDSPYETPENAEVRVNTTNQAPEQAAEQIVNYLIENGLLDSHWHDCFKQRINHMNHYYVFNGDADGLYLLIKSNIKVYF